jgi:hypothetical protein
LYHCFLRATVRTWLEEIAPPSTSPAYYYYYHY